LGLFRIHVTKDFYLPGSFCFPVFVYSGQKESYPQKMQITKESPDVIVVWLLPVNTDWQEIVPGAYLLSYA